MADTSLDKLVEEYLAELPRVMTAWDRWRKERDEFPNLGLADATAALDIAVCRFAPISEAVEQGAATRGLKSSTAPRVAPVL